jgi:hypothetical protein
MHSLRCRLNAKALLGIGTLTWIPFLGSLAWLGQKLRDGIRIPVSFRYAPVCLSELEKGMEDDEIPREITGFHHTRRHALWDGFLLFQLASPPVLSHCLSVSVLGLAPTTEAFLGAVASTVDTN